MCIGVRRPLNVEAKQSNVKANTPDFDFLVYARGPTPTSIALIYLFELYGTLRLKLTKVDQIVPRGFEGSNFQTSCFTKPYLTSLDYMHGHARTRTQLKTPKSHTKRHVPCKKRRN